MCVFVSAEAGRIENLITSVRRPKCACCFREALERFAVGKRPPGDDVSNLRAREQEQQATALGDLHDPAPGHPANAVGGRYRESLRVHLDGPSSMDAFEIAVFMKQPCRAAQQSPTGDQQKNDPANNADGRANRIRKEPLRELGQGVGDPNRPNHENHGDNRTDDRWFRAHQLRRFHDRTIELRRHILLPGEVEAYFVVRVHRGPSSMARRRAIPPSSSRAECCRRARPTPRGGAALRTARNAAPAGRRAAPSP
jgi:hypothetical protein